MTTPETARPGLPGFQHDQDVHSARTAGVRALATWDWRVDPPDGWLVVPSAYRGGRRTSPPGSAGTAAAVRAVARAAPDETASRSSWTRPRDADLDQAAAEAGHQPPGVRRRYGAGGHRVVAAVGVLGRGPVPVLVAVGVSDPADPDDGLMAALGATGGYPAAPPNVEYPDLPDGDGVRVTRLDVGEETGGGWMSVGLGRRAEHPDAVVDTVLVWRTQDLLLGAAMVELLDELLPAVRITRTEA